MTVASEHRFERIAVGLPIEGLCRRLREQPRLWKEITDRQTTPGSPHHDSECIFLRWCPDRSVAAAFYQLETIDYPSAPRFMPDVSHVMLELLRVLDLKEPDIGRVIITRLPPGAAIDEHMDVGPYAERYDRFHVCLEADKGNLFYVEGEPFDPVPGEAWWFNHKRQHAVVNLGKTPRVHMIVDVVAPAYRAKRGLYFQRERCYDWGLEALPLFERHRQEIAHYQDIPLDVDLDGYAAAEQAGQLRCFTARLSGMLVGYAVFLVGPNLHYRASLQARQDVLFVLPEHRNQGVGLELIRWSERALKAEGVQVLYQHIKAGGPVRMQVAAALKDTRHLGALLQSLDYELIDLIYGKRLDRKLAGGG